MRPMVSCRATSLILCLSAGAAMADCPALNARYAPEGEGMAGAELMLQARAFPSAQSDLDLVLVAPGLQQPLALEMIQSQGYGSINAFPPEGTDIEADEGFPLTFFTTTPAGRLLATDTVPQGTEKAPAALFVAGIGSALWYATNGQETPVMLRPALWYLTGCP